MRSKFYKQHFLDFSFQNILGGFPPYFLKQPIAGEMIFFPSLFKDPSKYFSIECEAEGNPMPK